MNSSKNYIDFSQQTFAVVGLGDTGISVIKYLKYFNAKIDAVLDTRKNPPYQNYISDINLYLGELRFEYIKNVDVIVISPGVSIYEPVLQEAIKNSKLVVGDIELFAHAISAWNNTKVIGITGSNGKTTVTTLTGYLATISGYNTIVAGNIGKPVLESYLEIVESPSNIPDVIVLELSSFQLETVSSLKLDVATVLNISENHLDRHNDLLEYAYIKSRIFNNTTYQLLNKDDVLVSSMRRQDLHQLWFGLKGDEDFTLTKDGDDKYLTIYKQKFLSCKSLQLVGIHNYMNCLVSLALLDSIKINIDTDLVKNALSSFQGLEHRMQKIVEKEGITYIEDSKGSTVSAVIAGVGGLEMPVHLILGGDGKGQNFIPLRQLVEKKCKSVAVIGKDKSAILKALDGLNLNISSFNKLEEAVIFCIKNAVAGDAVVLSPACASWDMFDNYKHRAKIFIDSIYENF